MKKVKKLLLWLWLLTKRLYKKPTFLTILILIPALVLGYSLAAQGDSGMVTVALAGEDGFTLQLFEQLEDSGQLLRYIRCDTAAYAELLVSTGKADAAWIFPEDTQSAIETFAKDPTQANAFVRVVQREENVALALARERLSGVIFPHVARNYYLQFIRQTYPELAELSDEAVLQYYDGTDMGGDLFEYDSTAAVTEPVHYLMSPVRGLLAAVILLGGMTTAMYWVKDTQNGTFQWLPGRYRILPELGSQLVTAVNLGAVSLMTLALSGLAEDLLLELLTLLLYSLTVAAFCMLLRRLLQKISVLGMLLPLLMVTVLAVCPVFFDLGALRPYQLLLPPTYYINGVYNGAYLAYALIFVTAAGGICLGWDKLLGDKTA